jgi:hypothetical protein
MRSFLGCKNQIRIFFRNLLNAPKNFFIINHTRLSAFYTIKLQEQI